MCRFLDEFCCFQVSLHAPNPDVWIDNRKPPAKIAARLVNLSGESYKISVLNLVLVALPWIRFAGSGGFQFRPQKTGPSFPISIIDRQPETLPRSESVVQPCVLTSGNSRRGFQICFELIACFQKIFYAVLLNSTKFCYLPLTYPDLSKDSLTRQNYIYLQFIS